MTRRSWRAIAAAIGCIAAVTALLPQHAVAQNPRTLDIGGPPGDSARHQCYTDSILTAALAAFNGPAAVHVFGGPTLIPAGDTISGTFGAFGGPVRVDGTIAGSLIVLNGDARITGTGVIRGDVVVLGGEATIDAGARIGGRRVECGDQVPLVRTPAGIVEVRQATRPMTRLASELALNVDGAQLTPYIGVGQYNRVEALPLQLGANARWSPGGPDTLRLQGYAVVRTGRDPAGSRPTVGWHASGAWSMNETIPFTIGIEGGQTVTRTSDRPASPIESGLSAFVLRRDYDDWFMRRGGSIFARAGLSPELTVSARYEIARQTTVLAVDALSLLRGGETWRPNPLIDDGKYHIASARVDWNAQDENRHPVFTWRVQAELRHVSSNALTPVSLPATIRDPLPATGYGETDGNFDVRGSFRVSPDQRVDLRWLGGGYLAGDPLTIQSRRAIGGVDPLLGYDFRAINCDRRRKPDPAQPALCDRNMALQLEYRRTLPLNLSTRVGGYTIGLRRPELVLFADAGSAWLAGDSAGRVPVDRIEAIREWKSDAGIGLSTRWASLYLARSLVDHEPVRLVLLFTSRR